MLKRVLHGAVWLVLGNLIIECAPAQDAGAEYFEKNVRPILSQHCLGCHTGSSRPMAGLALDRRAGLLKGGGRGPAVVAGSPAQSLLIRAVQQVDEHLKMPPSGKLKESEVAALAEWVRMGAPWGVETTPAEVQPKKYWAFVSPKDVRVPEVRNSKWVKSPVDAFVLAALEAKGLAPAPPADKRTLIRRATFDLTGLPPTPEEIRAFLDDHSPGAFARVVDRLLESPRYGERWGRHWLDVARYADSNGLDENLVYRNAFRYRDYVIQAFNKDKPYDQFVQEQLAGDLLPDAKDLATRFERYTATGFLSLGAKMLAEDDPVKMEMDIVDEQLDTTARTFMGLTVGCARCHDHKFDPIPQADYYSMAGIFKSSKTMENFKVVARWHEYVLAPKEDQDRLKAHEDKIQAKQAEISRIMKAGNAKLVAEAREKAGDYLLAADDVLRYERIRLKPVLGSSGTSSDAAVAIRAAGSFDLGNVSRKLAKESKNVPKEQTGPFFAEYVITLPAKGEYQIDILEQEAGRGTADILINGVLMKKGAPPVQNRAASPDAGGWSVAGIFPFHAGKNTIRLEQETRFPYFEKLLVAPNPLPAGETVPKTPAQVARQYGVNPGFLEQWVEEMGRSKGAPHSVLFAWFVFGTGQSYEGWTSAAARLFRDFKPATREELAGRYQALFLDAMTKWQALEATRKKEGAVERNTEKEEAAPKETGLADDALEALRSFLYEKAGVFRAPADSKQYFSPPVREQLTRLEAERKTLEAATPDLPRAMGVRESTTVADLAIHLRGSHWTLGKEVPRRFLRVIAGENQTPIGPQESGRLQLARWLTQPDHPLTSRVMVNRIWRWHFGRGIVPSTDNFGRLGEQPSNQPLLDWLALQFVQRGWSIKEMHRLLMLTNTYQMSSEYNERSYEIDPENILLWRMPRRRLEAEAIRDAIMSVSSDLDLSMGGSILKYKDRQYVADTAKGGDIDYDLNRRAVYIPVVRSSMYDMFQAFDLPDPSTANGDRNSTVVAPQALFMMNGSVLLKHSRRMAEGLLTRADLDDAGRIREAYERALGRPPAPKEIDGALTLIAQVSRAMESRQTDERDRRAFAWQSFCKSLIASNEFIYLN